MRLADLSEKSGVPIATIKYYLREGLVPPGRRITATQAEYDDSHLRRLRLVRALVQLGKVPLATVREVLAHVDDESLGRTIRLGAALWALPHQNDADAAEAVSAGAPDVQDTEDDPATVTARREVDRLLNRLGWEHCRELGALSPVYRDLVATVAALTRLGYPVEAGDLAPYARHIERIAQHDLDIMERSPTLVEQVEMAVAGTLLYEPVLLNLRRLAQEEEATRRYGLQ
ncbi:MerR family transcriptional regulator [Streptacidiphilus griseoplanus]|uniref:MerR family transcriptional regulator n=1 Tax=Peterkaempfera griseoplana TaxID=66896 RepID=UPI0006E2FEFE|nr:MerR family transcriptional regulator [Peterkaempfera griseoplana]